MGAEGVWVLVIRIPAQIVRRQKLFKTYIKKKPCLVKLMRRQKEKKWRHYLVKLAGDILPVNYLGRQ